MKARFRVHEVCSLEQGFLTRNYDRLAAMPAEHTAPKIAIGSIMHESNSFNAELTGLSDFRLRQGPDAEATLADWATGNSEMAGFIEEGARAGFNRVPHIFAA